MQKQASSLSCAMPDGVEQFVVYAGTENPGFPYRATLVDLQAAPGRRGTPAHKLLNAARRLRRLQAFLDANRIDAVVSFGEAANVLNLLTKRKRTVLSVQVSLPEGLAQMGRYGSAYGHLIRRLYPRADRIVAISDGIAGQLVEMFGVPREKIVRIYPFNDSAQIAALAAEPLPPAVADRFTRPTVINVGSLVAQKGQERLIRAFALARPHVSDLQLCLVGRGDQQGEFEALAESLGVRSSILFTGFDPNPYRYMARSSVFALCSRFEGFGNVLAEALLCGLPTISTDCPIGPREILGDSEYGLLLPHLTDANEAQGVEQLAESIVTLITTEAGEYYRQKARERSSAFRTETLLGQWCRAIGLPPEITPTVLAP
jgi:glycosyltransferase involved in cell wall biosynthesis